MSLDSIFALDWIDYKDQIQLLQDVTRENAKFNGLDYYKPVDRY